MVHRAPLSWPEIVVTRILTRDLFVVANLLVLIFCAVVQQQSQCSIFSAQKLNKSNGLIITSNADVIQMLTCKNENILHFTS